MHDHPVLGVALFFIGGLLAGFAFYISNVPAVGVLSALDVPAARDAISFLLLGHVLAFNGVLFIALWRREKQRTEIPCRTGVRFSLKA